MIIRKPTMDDVPEMVSLMEQLGYPTTVEKFKVRFKRISSHTEYHTLVADFDGRVVGMEGLCTGLFYEHDGSYVRILAFVVENRAIAV